MTANAAIWEAYGRRAVVTWLKHWPADAHLVLYVEDFDVPDELAADPRLSVVAMPAWHWAWKKRHADNADAHGRDMRRAVRPKNGYSYRRDCVKFSHKVAALTDAVLRGPLAGVVIMMDADVITHADVTPAWLQSIFPDPRYCAWLDRSAWDYPECGFVMFRADDPIHLGFMGDLRAMYETDAVFALQQTHDSFVLKTLVQRAVSAGLCLSPWSLSGSARTSSHPLPMSRLGECLDHLKGKRKELGATSAQEARRRGDHWG